MSPLKQNPSRRAGKRAARRALPRPALLAAAAAALCVLLLAVSFLAPRRPDTLPGQVQQAMPSWVQQELLTPNEYSRPQIPLEEVNAVVIHYVGNPGTSAEANRSYFEGLAVSGETYASSNFIIGLEGEILQCVPVDEVAYCSSDRNGDTVSIEVCHPDETGQFTAASMSSLIRLTAWLCEAFGLDPETGIIRHYDVTGKECPLYYVEHPEAWDVFRADVALAMEEDAQ